MFFSKVFGGILVRENIAVLVTEYNANLWGMELPIGYSQDSKAA